MTFTSLSSGLSKNQNSSPLQQHENYWKLLISCELNGWRLSSDCETSSSCFEAFKRDFSAVSKYQILTSSCFLMIWWSLRPSNALHSGSRPVRAVIRKEAATEGRMQTKWSVWGQFGSVLWTKWLWLEITNIIPHNKHQNSQAITTEDETMKVRMWKLCQCRID